MKHFLSIIFIFSNIFFINSSAAVNTHITATIKPLYNITKAISTKDDTVNLLLSNNTSPHDYQLKPSDVKLLNNSSLIIWGGENLEPYLAKIISNNKLQISSLDTSKIMHLKKLNFKENHSHSHHNNHEHQHEHQHLGFDPHTWLNPENSIIIADMIKSSLIKLNPNKSKEYSNNYKKFKEKINLLITSINKQLSTIKDNKYMVYHDGYQYFEDFFGLNNAGVINYNPGSPLGAKHSIELQQIIKQQNITCIFKEPQYNTKFIDNLQDKFVIKQGILDPIGDDKDLGKNGYFILLQKLADNLSICLQQ